MKVSEMPGCQNCAMARLFPDNNFVPHLNGSSLRLAVAEAPGEQEAEKMEPLVGGSGKIQNNLWRSAGVSRDEITITNTICCRPPQNIYPTDPAARSYCSDVEGREAVEQCRRSYLEPLLKSRPWTRIDAIGEKSLRALTGKTEGIMKWRGAPLPLKGESKPRVIGTLHPAYLMRDNSFIPVTVSDLSKSVIVPEQHYNTTPTLEQVEAFDATTFAFDIETNRFNGAITMVGLSARSGHVIVVPFAGAYIPALRKIFDRAKEVIGQNCIQFDLPHLKDAGITVSPTCKVWDIMLMYHLVAPDSPHFDLEFIASICTNVVPWKHLEHEDMQWYNATDVDATFQSWLVLRSQLKYKQLEDLYSYVQVPLARICGMMSSIGVKTDQSRLKQVRGVFEKELRELEGTLPKELQPYERVKRVRKPAPPGTLGKSGKPVKYVHEPSSERVVPWQSPERVANYLYNVLRLPKQLHAKTKQLSTDKNALERLAKSALEPARTTILALRRLRQLEELISTFLKDGDSNGNAVGRVHTNFLVHGTSTGRLASSGPNLQNIPPSARYIYVPSHTDWCFVEGDFSSLENRLAAWYANDSERLARLDAPGFNEHRWLASKIYGVPESELTKEDWRYHRGKITNHGCDGAMGPRKLALTHSLPEKEARELIFQWRSINAKSAEWQEKTGNDAVKSGVTTNNFGRKRWYWSKSGYTEGIRFFPQSTGADICFRSMVALLYERIGWPIESVLKVSNVLAPLPHPARLILQVHDSLLVETPRNLVEQVIDCMRRAMQQPWRELGGFSIPVDFKVGEPGASWAELEHIKMEETV